MSVREGYKQTEIGIIPEEWEVINLKDLVYRPLAYGVLKPGEYEEKGIYMLRIQDIKTNTIDYNSLFRIPKSLDLEFKRTKLNEGDLILSLVGTIGKVLKINDKLAGANVTRAFSVIGIKEKQSIDYIEQYLKSFFMQKWIAEQSKGNAQKVLNIENVKNLPVIYPPLPEQQRIAEILSTVDQKIDSIDSKITETETLKRGLMQRLLTEGIGHSEFKDSEIGRIPKGWNYQTFEEAKIQIIDGDRGTNYPKQHDFFQNEFCLFLSAKNVTKRGFEFTEKQFITQEKDSLLRKGKLEMYDLVLTTRGTVGNIAYFDDTVSFENMRINSGMVLLRVQDNLDSKYLYKIMTSELIQNNIQNIAFGSAQPQLTVKEIKNFKIPIPPLEEQKQIAEILSTTDEKLKTLRTKKEAFETLKKGLIQKLLSGEVRVK